MDFRILIYSDYHLFWLFGVLICYYVYHYVHSMCCILCVCINVNTLYCIYDLYSLVMEYQILLRHCLIWHNYLYKRYGAGY